MSEKPGFEFLKQKYNNLHTKQPVEHAQKEKKRRGEEASQKPVDKIGDFMSVLERTHGHHDNPEVLERIKEGYHNKYVIKEEKIPEEYLYKQKQEEAKRAFDEGRGEGLEKDENGNFIIPEEENNLAKETLINDQKDSLDSWVDYLSSEDATYPTWAKYWAFNSVTKMGKLEKYLTCANCGKKVSEGDKVCENEECNKQFKDQDDKKSGHRFQERTENTISPFPTLNARVLAKTIEAIEVQVLEKQKPKKQRGDIENLSLNLDDEEYKKLLSTENFSKLYVQFLGEMPEYSREGLKEIKGEWKKYDQGSEPDELVDSLKGYPLEWCTATYSTAKTQLQGGAFYIYYSNTPQGEPKIPRIAVRMDSNEIAEIRGIEPGQNMDPYITTVLKEKMKDFPGGEKYEKKIEDMKRLKEVYYRYEKDEELDKDDLNFIYEIDNKIEGFGFEKDSRIPEILKNRDKKEDISKVIGFKKEQISLTKEEALGGKDIEYHHGNLYLNRLQSAEHLKLPETVGGDVCLNDLQSEEKEKLREKYPQFADKI